MQTGIVSPRIQTINCLSGSPHEDMKREIRAGLTAYRKHLPCKYFYDARGSQLFEKICGLPEYYQTRTELSILKHEAAGLMRHAAADTIVELGSGANWKIRALLDARSGRHAAVHYVPVDVCGAALTKAAEELIVLYPELTVLCVEADFTNCIHAIPVKGAKLIALFGSTIGNISDRDSRAFMNDICSIMGPDDRFLVGIDMVKPKDILEAAYNDSQGVTAAFNKNILSVLNRELNARFDPSDFDHVAFYNEDSGSVEMHLRANRDVSVRVNGLDLSITMITGETIHTEICRKFRRDAIERAAADAGLAISGWFSDDRGWFSLVEMIRRK